jgi:hypothetical protein
VPISIRTSVVLPAEWVPIWVGICIFSREKKKGSIDPAFLIEKIELGKIVPKAAWLKEVFGKWPGDEPIQELLAMFENVAK